MGENVDPQEIKIGTLYGVLGLSPCVRPTPGFPEAALNTPGLGLDGGFAEYIVILATQLVKVVSIYYTFPPVRDSLSIFNMPIQPTGLRPEVAAIACNAGVTAFNAVYNVAGVSLASPPAK